MASETLELDIHGVRVAVVCQDAGLLGELRRDFAWFLAPGEGEARVRLELRLSPPPRSGFPVRSLLRWRSARIAHEGGLRRVDYDGRALLEYDLAREEGVLWGESPELLHELAYLAVLSRAGEALDRRGLHRVHALGFTHRGRGGLVLLPMGGGKSRLALELLRREGFGLLSDDMPLLEGSGRRLAAFPLRLGLRGGDRSAVPERYVRPFQRRRFGMKYLVDLDYFRAKVEASAPLSWVLVGERGGGGPGLEPCSAAAAAGALAAGMVGGFGLPQVLELMLPAPPFVGGALRLAALAARRSAAALRALQGSRTCLFRMTEDAGAGAEALEGFLARDRSR